VYSNNSFAFAIMANKGGRPQDDVWEQRMAKGWPGVFHVIWCPKSKQAYLLLQQAAWNQGLGVVNCLKASCHFCTKSFVCSSI